MKTKEQIEAKIEKLQKKLKELETPKLEKGRWYKHDEGGVYYATSFSKVGSMFGYGVESDGDWYECISNNGIGCLLNNYHTKECIRPATREEVESALIKEAKRRGYDKGVRISSVYSDMYKGRILGDICVTETYQLWADSDECANVQIFEDGKWAEIIEKSKVNINGYDMEVNGNEVKFGCAKFTDKQFKYLKHYLEGFSNFSESNRKINSITLDSGVEITVEQLKQICDELN